MVAVSLASLVVLGGVVSGCGSDSDGPAAANPGGASGEGGAGGSAAADTCETHASCTESLPYCNPESSACEKAPEGGIIGWGDGSPGSVSLEAVYSPTFKRQATDLAFHPTRPNELWVLHRQPEVDAPCTESSSKGCSALEGSVSILTNVGKDNQAAKWKKDPNAWHFMRRPPALAFGANDTFATVGEFRTGNFTDDLADFIGPSLWSSDPEIFGIQPKGLNGSHIDMLHSTPFGMGIAHEKDNVYWVFNGDVGALDRYDFKEDHGPGHDDHSDGETLRYVEGELLRVAGTPSHLIYDAKSSTVLVADTGNGRVVRFDPAGATDGDDIESYEQVALAHTMEGGTLTNLVPKGTLKAPTGIEIDDGIIYVSDAETSHIHAFTGDGKQVRELDTGLPKGSLAGMAIYEGALYFVELPTSKVYKIVPRKE